MNQFSTGVKGIDKLLDGGILLGAPALIYGIPNLGKREESLIEEDNSLSAKLGSHSS